MWFMASYTVIFHTQLMVHHFIQQQRSMLKNSTQLVWVTVLLLTIKSTPVSVFFETKRCLAKVGAETEEMKEMKELTEEKWRNSLHDKHEDRKEEP